MSEIDHQKPLGELILFPVDRVRKTWPDEKWDIPTASQVLNAKILKKKTTDGASAWVRLLLTQAPVKQVEGNIEFTALDIVPDRNMVRYHNPSTGTRLVFEGVLEICSEELDDMVTFAGIHNERPVSMMFYPNGGYDMTVTESYVPGNGVIQQADSLRRLPEDVLQNALRFSEEAFLQEEMLDA